MWQPDAYCMCHIIFVHHYLSLLYPVDHNLHVSLSTCNTYIAILYILSKSVLTVIAAFRKSIKVIL